jgi:hypothetical protein
MLPRIQFDEASIQELRILESAWMQLRDGDRLRSYSRYGNPPFLKFHHYLNPPLTALDIANPILLDRNSSWCCRASELEWGGCVCANGDDRRLGLPSYFYE